MKKLYVVVRNDLSRSQQAVQAGHALAEYVLANRNIDWDNGTLVYLSIRDEHELKDLTERLEYDRIHHNSFREPDMDNQMTAIASLGNNEHFEKMRLI